jgi:hypothetical protein
MGAKNEDILCQRVEKVKPRFPFLEALVRKGNLLYPRVKKGKPRFPS